MKKDDKKSEALILKPAFTSSSCMLPYIQHSASLVCGFSPLLNIKTRERHFAKIEID
jgi:hypothetical protein